MYYLVPYTDLGDRWLSRCLSPLLSSALVCVIGGGGGGVKNAYELLNLRALKISMYENHIFQCMCKIFCVEFQIPHKISTHTLKIRVLCNVEILDLIAHSYISVFDTQIHTEIVQKRRRNDPIIMELLGNPTSIYRLTNHLNA